VSSVSEGNYLNFQQMVNGWEEGDSSMQQFLGVVTDEQNECYSFLSVKFNFFGVLLCWMETFPLHVMTPVDKIKTEVVSLMIII